MLPDANDHAIGCQGSTLRMGVEQKTAPWARLPFDSDEEITPLPNGLHRATQCLTEFSVSGAILGRDPRILGIESNVFPCAECWFGIADNNEPFALREDAAMPSGSAPSSGVTFPHNLGALSSATVEESAAE